MEKSIGWKEDYEARQRAVKEELNALVREYRNKLEEHDLHEEDPYCCYHVMKCKCGFQEACDSSD